MPSDPISTRSKPDQAQRLLDLFAGAQDYHGTYNHLEVVSPKAGVKVEIKSSARTVKTGPTVELWRRHLAGVYPLGVSPHRSDDMCIWGAIDVDDYIAPSLLSDLNAIIERDKLPVTICRSKSGGAHLLLFATDPVPASQMQDFLRATAACLGLPPKTEVFPKQRSLSQLPPDDDGHKWPSWLNMPYFGGDQTDRFAVKRGGLAMTAEEFLYTAESRKVAPGQIAAPLPTRQSKPSETAPTVSEFDEWFAAKLLKLADAPRKDADNSLFRLAIDLGRWANAVNVDLDAGELKARAAWHQRGKSDADFDQCWRYNLNKGMRLGNPPRLVNGRVLPVVTNLSEFTIVPVEWLWPGRIAVGKLSIVAGHPGLGKSQLTMYIAAKVTTGGAWPFDEGVAKLGRVLVLSAEDDPADTILPRMLAAGGDPASVTVLEAVRAKEGDRTFDLSTDIDALDRELDDGDYVLVIVDPISAYLGNTGRMDSNSNTHVRGVLEPLKRLAEAHRVAIVCVTHLIKAGGREAIGSVNGSVAFVAAARTVLIVSKEIEEVEDEDGRKEKFETGRRLVAVAKNNIGPDSADQTMVYEVATREICQGIVAPYVHWAEKKQMTADEAIGYRNDTKPGPKTAKKDRAAALLRRMLRDGPVAMTELVRFAEAEGIGRDTLDNAKNQIGVKSNKTPGKNGAWLWYLPGRQEELPI
ncbi:AAA family ATPase [Mesorhizobium sp. M3A.F.Ca.ET.080.04.2.1]|uniref:AAA family ATPase n=1 Tax=Mesorhizobium sp. M3A.F.Ca.ET.080.04.2.1 TaxID=2493676 RepID=UPI000F75155A|nr:AAA family ATPase [Mesorhizobium sp. M3A.F.Ca.ET.080.04.2.1]AZO12535.1 AAA family ATPase [Mesorhizobium sp. M3A.F.Ca.ET.080.04.2.1]RWF26444.1 MAG: AAA family ATPase [Mesorhizobium sp.]